MALAPRLRMLGLRARGSSRARFVGLDNLDERLLPHIRTGRGTFVELGAFDGLAQSNTAWLEANMGWRGILIEAIPEVYEECVRNRPLATVVNCACVSAEYPSDTVEMIYSGLMSIVRGARLSDEEDRAWVSLGEDLQQLDSYTCTVPARTLTDVLREEGLRRVDLLSLDVEGYEIEVLRGFDLDRFRPAHILIEQSHDDGVTRHLRSKGYREKAELARGRFTRDVLYERAAEPEGRVETMRLWTSRRRYFAMSFLRRTLRRLAASSNVTSPQVRGGDG